jgi:hypothetical protein
MLDSGRLCSTTTFVSTQRMLHAQAQEPGVAPRLLDELEG